MDPANDQTQKAEIVVMLAEAYGVDLSEPRLKVYLYALNDVTLEELIVVFDQCVKATTNERMPSPGALRALARPELNSKQEAIRVVDLIKDAVRRFGWTDPCGAKNFLGEQTWQVVERLGGWSRICESPELNLGDKIIYAQVRDNVETQVQALRSRVDYSAPQIAAAAGKLLQLEKGGKS